MSERQQEAIAQRAVDNGESLPQVLLNDPNWFFLELPRMYGALRGQAEELARKARAIKIPKRQPNNWCVEYWYKNDKNVGRFSFVKADSDQKSKWTVRRRCLDLSWFRGQEAYARRGNGKLIARLRRHYFGGKKLTKKRCEAFFENDDNFEKSKLA